MGNKTQLRKNYGFQSKRGLAQFREDNPGAGIVDLKAYCRGFRYSGFRSYEVQS
ncbi:hypothetical protein VB638_16790 [Dolichospermum sp. UHCC 0684]|uniref:hypothetical protein n=1 Tax=unclassified Dolichospermum TaxID=2622029 RepID=UPI0014456086|nr:MULTISPECIES: hypothetical protein [unclassified Dolichospermum]MEA5531204.1 hypothetical protein [Dolichospermum sp. UHCC 0684]